MKDKAKIIFILLGLFVLINVRSSFAFIDEKEYDTIKETLRTGDMVERLRQLKRIEAVGLEQEAMRELLMTVFESDDIRIVTIAVGILYNHGDHKAIDHLFRFIDGPYSNNVKVRAIKAIVMLGGTLYTERLCSYFNPEQDADIVLAIAEGVMTDLPGDFYEEILNSLKMILMEGNPSLKIKTLTILERLGVQAVPFIVVALDDADSVIKQEAFNVLTRIGGPAAIQAIRTYAHDENKDVVYYAAFALALLGEPSYFRFIQRDLAAEDPQVQLYALRFLKSKAGFGGEEYFMGAIKRLSEYALNDEVKSSAKEYMNFYEQIAVRNQPPGENAR